LNAEKLIYSTTPSARLQELFEKQPSHTVNQAIAIIFEETGVRLKHSACQPFLKKIGMKCRRCGLVPGKATDDEKQRQAQEVFHDQQLLAGKAKAPGIEFLYLPANSPNLNLIERLWRFVKKQVLYSTHYDNFDAFRTSIDSCIADLGTRFKANMQTLVTMNFQLFSKKPENLTA
jgi:hypothetical protein